MKRKHGSLQSNDADQANDEAARDDASIVFFDGVCNLCNAFVDLCVRNTPASSNPASAPLFRFAPLQGETAAHLVPELARSLSSVVVRTHKGEIHTHAAAALFVLSKLEGAHWRLLARLGAALPVRLSTAAYNLVAAKRYAFFGKRSTCRLPTPQERALFLD